MSIPLYDAIAIGDFQTVKRLLESTDRIKDTDNQYRRLIDMTKRTSAPCTIAGINGKLEVLSYLINVGVPCSDHTTLMTLEACSRVGKCLHLCITQNK
jgi:hypothetical protein